MPLALGNLHMDRIGSAFCRTRLERCKYFTSTPTGDRYFHTAQYLLLSIPIYQKFINSDRAFEIVQQAKASYSKLFADFQFVPLVFLLIFNSKFFMKITKKCPQSKWTYGKLFCMVRSAQNETAA